jgi:hypothetical protein
MLSRVPDEPKRMVDPVTTRFAEELEAVLEEELSVQFLWNRDPNVPITPEHVKQAAGIIADEIVWGFIVEKRETAGYMIEAPDEPPKPETEGP